MALVMVEYILNDNGPRFSPDLEIDSEVHLLGLINSLLEDMIEMGSRMKRIADGYPPYNVEFFFFFYDRIKLIVQVNYLL